MENNKTNNALRTTNLARDKRLTKTTVAPIPSMQRAVWWTLFAFCLWNAALSRAQEVTTRIIQPSPLPGEGNEENITEETSPRRHAEREEVVTPGDWELYYSSKLTVDPEETVSIFTIPVGQLDSRSPARFDIDMAVPNPPEGCNPNTTLWYSPAIYHEELCMERDWMGKCTLPGGDGFKNKSELVDHYGRFKRVLFDAEAYELTPYEEQYLTDEERVQRQTIRRSMRGNICYDDRDYWLAFSTVCGEATVVKITVNVKSARFIDKWTCRGFHHFMVAQHGSDAFARSKLFWAIIIPIGYFTFLFGMIMGIGYIFQCGAKGRVTMLLKVNLSFDFDDDDSEEEERRRSPRHRKKKR